MYDDHHLTRYLLGELDEEATQTLDEQLVADDLVTERVARVEDDLVDAYVRGELDADRAERLAARLGASEMGRERIAFARTLHARTRDAAASRPQEAAADGPPIESEDGPAGRKEGDTSTRAQPIDAARRRRSPGPRLAWAALLAAGLGTGWWALQNSRPTAAPSPSLLLVQAVRGPTPSQPELPSTSLPDGAEILVLTIDLEAAALPDSSDASRLVASLHDAHDDVRWRTRDVRLDGPVGARAAIVDVPAGELPPGRYALHLVLQAPDAPPQRLGRYGFAITPAR